MFSATEKDLLVRLGHQVLFEDQAVQVYQDSTGNLHAHEYCNRGFAQNEYPKVTVNAPEVKVTCPCFADSSAPSPLATLYAVKQLMGQIREATSLLEYLNRVHKNPGFTSVRAAWATTQEGVSVYDSLRRPPGRLPVSLQELYAEAVTQIRERQDTILDRYGHEALVTSCAAHVAVAEVGEVYGKVRPLESRRAFRELLSYWNDLVQAGTTPAQRRKRVLRAVGTEVKLHHCDPRAVGLAAKQWLRDAERILDREIRANTDAPVRLAVYGANNRLGGFELGVYDLKQVSGQVLVAVPDQIRKRLGALGIHPVRCADRPCSKEIAEVAAALWAPSLTETFNDLSALLTAGEALLK